MSLSIAKYGSENEWVKQEGVKSHGREVLSLTPLKAVQLPNNWVLQPSASKRNHLSKGKNNFAINYVLYSQDPT